MDKVLRRVLHQLTNLLQHLHKNENCPWPPRTPVKCRVRTANGTDIPGCTTLTVTSPDICTTVACHLSRCITKPCCAANHPRKCRKPSESHWELLKMIWLLTGATPGMRRPASGCGVH